MSQEHLPAIKLSICIATYNRGDLITETLDSIVTQLTPEVELLIVDGASPDNTATVMADFCSRHAQVRFIREDKNSGVDADFDKAVAYARGEYCWLMPDDDLLVPDAVNRVVQALEPGIDLVVVDAEVRTVDFQRVLQRSRMSLDQDVYFAQADDAFLAMAGDNLSFIGAVVIRRQAWLQRDRESYYGSLFIHMGVILQAPPLCGIRVLAKPTIRIRYGNAMWTARTFEIWMFMWPGLVWSFPGFTDRAKQAVCHREPWRVTMELCKHRAKGSYTHDEYSRHVKHRLSGRSRAIAGLIAKTPASWMNFLAVAHVVTLNRQARLGLSDLLGSPHASAASRMLARLFPVSELEG